MRCGPVTEGMRWVRTLYYRFTGADVVDVVRILHQRMDVDRHLD